MNSSIFNLRKQIAFLIWIVITAAYSGINTSNSFAQNPNSGTTTTGQILTVFITSPNDSTVFPGPPTCVAEVNGLVTISSVKDTAINVLYVLDVSGSTTDPTFYPPIDVNGDGVIDSGDNFNADDVDGDILDAEIAGVMALNQSIHNFTHVEVGVIAYASRAANADVNPAVGYQNFIMPPHADLNSNGISDIEEVLRSLDSELIAGGSIKLFQPISRDSLGNSTNFEAALREVLNSLASQPGGEKNIVFFLSDGKNEIGGSLDDEISLAAARGIVINTIGITDKSNPEDLSKIAAGTGGTFKQVTNPADLQVELPKFPVLGIEKVEVNGQTVELDAVGAYDASINLDGGKNTIAATATATDQTQVTARIAVFCTDLLSCDVKITSPADGAVICGDSVTVEGITNITGGVPPISIKCLVNGVEAEVLDNRFKLTLPRSLAGNVLIATCLVVDNLGNESVCQDSISVTWPAPLFCQVKITTPPDSAFLCADSVEVKGETTISGGVTPVDITCEVNGIPATVSGNTFQAKVPLIPGGNLLVATCTVVDSCGKNSVCLDTVRVFTSEPPNCDVEITSPMEDAFFCADSVDVKGVTSISGGSPPFDISCDVNGLPAAVSGNTFEVKVPLVPGENLLVATCTVTDSCGNQTVCRDTVRVFTNTPPVCEVEIISPDDSAVVCTDSVKVIALTHLLSGSATEISCEINGEIADRIDSQFTATVPMTSGENLIVATCTVQDTCGLTAVCRDSITVFYDDIPPTCTLTHQGKSVIGTFFDEHSGIAQIIPVKLKNASLLVDPFTPGDKRVNFRIDAIDPDQPRSFSIDVYDVCGNKFNCDPVFMSLSADGAQRQFAFTFPHIERYFQIRNYGLSEIRVAVNGHKFSLLADPLQVETEANAYLLPEYDWLTIDLVEYLHEGENDFFVAYEGFSGTHADLFLLDVVEEVDFVLRLETLPEEFQLAQNYPNPFNPTTRIQYDIPEKMVAGVQVQLKIYNLLGELVRVLVDEQKSPGQYLVEWDARNENRVRVSSGIYIYQLTAGEFRATKRMLLLK